MLIINLVGLCLIGFVVWWFWLYKPEKVQLEGEDIVITVENGTYSPSSIQLPAGKKVRLHFLRKDPSPCSESVIFSDLKISEHLALNKMTAIELGELNKGTYVFHCQMQMYRGQISVE